ncbi:hypothetical protein EWB00_001707 [Schistosoma japonicum]|uniref:Uncharacterized protein n=1 Tax=Schistosoma japonicum TaxID=6182 RepID=A0A4Z2DEI2_SCHJA|nr:hypothetical protein EWB00_001705 [Schistosoma japonicum]TNN14897.1 hypothetical protein EWB00_001707 [Schistosoma japonicum]
MTMEVSSQNVHHHRDHIRLRGYHFPQQHRITDKSECVGCIQDNTMVNIGSVKTISVMAATPIAYLTFVNIAKPSHLHANSAHTYPLCRCGIDACAMCSTCRLTPVGC